MTMQVGTPFGLPGFFESRRQLIKIIAILNIYDMEIESAELIIDRVSRIDCRNRSVDLKIICCPQ